MALARMTLDCIICPFFPAGNLFPLLAYYALKALSPKPKIETGRRIRCSLARYKLTTLSTFLSIAGGQTSLFHQLQNS
jgi:hypothetical protein